MNVALLLFPGVTALDAIGPYEVLVRVPGWQVTFVATEPGPQRTDTGATSLEAGTAISEAGDPDIVLIPGGQGSREAMADADLLEWVARASAAAAWTTSVCTGSLVLAAAGVLEGRRATTHWLYLERLRELGAIPVAERVVFDGHFVTAAGVSSGITASGVAGRSTGSGAGAGAGGGIAGGETGA